MLSMKHFFNIIGIKLKVFFKFGERGTEETQWHIP